MQEDQDKNPEQQVGEQNPTLNSPGSKVSDYGNTTGGTANDGPEQMQGKQNNRQGNSSVPLDEEDTVGNP